MRVVVSTIDTMESYEADPRFLSSVPVDISATLVYAGCRISLYGTGTRRLGILYTLSSIQDIKCYEKDCFSLGPENLSDHVDVGYDGLVRYLRVHVGEELILYNEVTGKIMFRRHARAIVVIRIRHDNHIQDVLDFDSFLVPLSWSNFFP